MSPDQTGSLPLPVRALQTVAWAHATYETAEDEPTITETSLFALEWVG